VHTRCGCTQGGLSSYNIKQSGDLTEVRRAHKWSRGGVIARELVIYQTSIFHAIFHLFHYARREDTNHFVVWNRFIVRGREEDTKHRYDDVAFFPSGSKTMRCLHICFVYWHPEVWVYTRRCTQGVDVLREMLMYRYTERCTQEGVDVHREGYPLVTSSPR